MQRAWLLLQYHREVTRLVSGEDRVQLGVKLQQFANQWMKFVSEKCERGRGLRPRSESVVLSPMYSQLGLFRPTGLVF